MGLIFETGIKEPRSEAFQLQVRAVKRWVPIAAYRDGVEVHGLRKLKYVLWYGLGGMLIVILVSLPLLFLGVLLTVLGFLVAMADTFVTKLEQAGDRRRQRRRGDGPTLRGEMVEQRRA